MKEKRTVFPIQGMHCPHCEDAVCRAVKDLPGFSAPQADWRSGTLTALWDEQALPRDRLARAIAAAGYELKDENRDKGILSLAAAALLLAGTFVLLAMTPLQGWLGAFPVAQAGMSLGALFVVGLFTSLHCVAMCGGINLAQSAASAQAGKRVMRANGLYNLGRVISYTLIGALVGALGAALRVSTGVQAAIQAIAAALMLLMALGMLNLPGVMALLPSLPDALRLRLMGKGSRSSFYIGLLNGLMPCGPLQAMQLYALSAGSWWMGALSMLVFSLGTVPLMLGFGWVSGRLNQRFARPMRLISAVLVAVMGVNMLVNGLSLAGVRFPQIGRETEQVQASGETVQLITSELDWRGYPAITVKKGVPVRWVIHAEERKLTGCNREIVIPALEMRIPLQAGDNVIEFTAEEAGVIPFSCWMGMIRSSITVVEGEI